VTLHEVNACNRPRFVEKVGWVFEHSPWVAERAWIKRPFTSLEQLHGAMAAEVNAASSEEQLSLLRAHPDLGTRAALSAASASEQADAGLDDLTPGEFERLHRLNSAYREKFGFPFLFAVKGSTKHDILDALEARLPASREREMTEALGQVARIARFRLEELIS
jgi:2-oxo-4-hydroxy-4-carboxy-5-ureidoimidazoline decarboxylase